MKKKASQSRQGGRGRFGFTPDSSPPSPPVFATTRPRIPDHEVLRCVGRGSYGEVWLARNVMGTYRAVKVVYRQAFDHERPYERELEGIEKFEPVSRRHESQVDILHVGRNDDEGYFYYVMELADPVEELSIELGSSNSNAPGATGNSVESSACIEPETYAPRTVKHELNERGQLPIEECLRIGLALTTALQHLHDHKLVHRDVKPSNIIFVNGLPKLADIGLVATMDATMSFVGTEGYVPPDGPGTPQADIYALGKVLYEISMGKDRRSFPLLPENLDDGSSLEPLIEFNAVLIKACQNEPRQRYQSAREMHADLLLLQSGRSVQRLRLLERRLVWGRKLVVALLAVGLLTSFTLFQSRKVQNLTRKHLAHMHVASGARLLEDNELFGSLLYFSEALLLEKGENEQAHRIRFDSTLDQCPKLAGIFTHGTAAVIDAVFHPRGSHLLTLGEDHKARLWEVASGELTHTFEHDSPILHAEFSVTGDTLLTLSLDNQVQLWNTLSGDKAGLPFQHHHGVGIFSGYSVLVGSDYLSVNKFRNRFFQTKPLPITNQLRNLTLVLSMTGEGTDVRITSRLLDRRHGGVEVFSQACVDTMAQDKLSFGIETPSANYLGSEGFFSLGVAVGTNDLLPSMVAFDNAKVLIRQNGSSDSLVLDDFDDNALTAWTTYIPGSGEVAEMHQRIELRQDRKYERSLVLAHHAAQRFALEDGKTVEFQIDLMEFSHPNAMALLGFVIPNRWIRELPVPPLFSPDGRSVLTVTKPATAEVRDLTSNQVISLVHSNPLVHASFDRTGQRLFTVTRTGTPRLWDMTTGRQSLGARSQLSQQFGRGQKWSPDRRTTKGRFAPNGQLLATVFDDDRFARVWNLPEGELMQELGHAREIVDLSFSPEGERLLTASLDTTVQLWDLHTGDPLLNALTHDSGIKRVLFSPDGRRILTWTEASVVRLWNADSGEQTAPPIHDVVSLPEEPFDESGHLLTTVHKEGAARVWDLSSIRARILPVRYGRYDSDLTTNSPWLVPVTRAVPPREVGWRIPFAGVERALVESDMELLVSIDRKARVQIWDAQLQAPLTTPLKTKYYLPPAEPAPLDLRSDDKWSAKDLRDIAQLLSGSQLADTGQPQPLDHRTLTNTWRRLKYKFASMANQVSDWHKQMLIESEQAWDWQAALFHYNRLVGQQPRDTKLNARRRYAEAALENARTNALDYSERRRVIPPRPPDADPGTVDLSAHYNTSLKEELDANVLGRNLSGLPNGMQSFAGTRFDVRGGVRLASAMTRRSGRDFPATVRIPVRKNFHQIHFLHASIGDTGNLLATYTIHHANGGVTGFDVIGERLKRE